MTNLPIEWQDKVNSPELLALLQNFGATHYLSAEEVNQLRDAVNELFETTSSITPEEIEVINDRLSSLETLPTANTITAQTGFSLTGLDFTVNAGWEWILENTPHTNPAPVVVPVELCDAGKKRIDYIVPNNTNGFDLVPGAETTGIPAAPVIPNKGMYVTFFIVTDTLINEPSNPNLGNVPSLEEVINVYPFSTKGFTIQEKLSDESSNSGFHVMPRFLALWNWLAGVPKYGKIMWDNIGYNVTFQLPNTADNSTETLAIRSDIESLETAVDNKLDLKVDKDGAKVLSDVNFSTSLSNKLASIDATHYLPPLQTTVQLSALVQATIADKARVYVENDLADYFYDATASSGDIAPDDQAGGVGFWRKVAVGGETPTSVMTKYESNADRNALTDTLKSNYDTAYTHSQSTHAPNDAQKNSDITKPEIEAKLTGEISTHTHPGGGTLDTVPTDGSTNGVESNGVFDALAGKANDSGVIHTTGNETKTGNLGIIGNFNTDSGTNGVSGVKINRLPSNIGVSSTLGTSQGAAYSVTRDASGNIYTANATTDNITKITPAGVSTVFATVGDTPVKIIIDAAGNLYTANANGDSISKITPAGVSTILGATYNPSDLVVDSSGNIFTVSNNNVNIVKITPAGVVTTFANIGGGSSNITIDNIGNLYVSQYASQLKSIKKITPAGVVTTLATLTIAPYGIVVDSLGNVYTNQLWGEGGYHIMKTTPAGVVTIFATFTDQVSGLIIDSFDNIFLAASVVDKIFRIKPDATVSLWGTVFVNPVALVADPSGNVFVTEGDLTVTKITPPIQRVLMTNSSGEVVNSIHLKDVEYADVGKRVTASITGTYNIDWDAGDTFVLTVTGNVTISNTNLPTGTNTKTIEVELKGNFVVTLPTTWTALPSSQTYSATKWNHYVVSCINGTTSSENIKYANEVETI